MAALGTTEELFLFAHLYKVGSWLGGGATNDLFSLKRGEAKDWQSSIYGYPIQNLNNVNV